MPTPDRYPVSICPGEPKFDSLPVAKITHYPLEPRDYKPFAQGILCLSEGRLHLRMWAFEVSPRPTSTLACVCYPYPDAPRRALSMRFEHGEGDLLGLSVDLLEQGKPAPMDDDLQRRLYHGMKHRPHNGEDLQGVYWGMGISLPVALLEELGGAMALQPGAVFPGNFYKLSQDAQLAHQGSHFPAQFPDAPFARESMGRFELVGD